MAVQILNDMPDVAVHRGEALEPMRALAPQRPEPRWLSRVSGRAWFAAGTAALHLLALAGFMNAQRIERVLAEPEPMVVSLIDAPTPPAESPRDTTPAPQDIQYVLPQPQDVTYEAETLAPPVVTTTAIADPGPSVIAPPVVESVEYVRAPAPVYPSESSRRRERGTVLLRVLVDALGRPAQIQLERSSGFPRLDDAARAAVQNALFRPHEVNGVAQPAQVLIPIEFTRRAS
jgi:periplasmic protein TonB